MPLDYVPRADTSSFNAADYSRIADESAADRVKKPLMSVLVAVVLLAVLVVVVWLALLQAGLIRKQASPAPAAGRAAAQPIDRTAIDG
jgi:hypothetical protein